MIQSNRNSHEEIANRLADTQGVQQALKRAVSETIREHAMSGHKIVVWRENQIVWEEVSLASIPTEHQGQRGRGSKGQSSKVTEA